jgi:hypothetical protein
MRDMVLDLVKPPYRLAASAVNPVHCLRSK